MKPGAAPTPSSGREPSGLVEVSGGASLSGLAGPRPKRRFRTRVFLYLAVLSLATSAVSGGTYYRRQVKFIERDRALRAHTLLTSLATQTELGAYAGDPALCELPVRRTFREPDVVMVGVYDARGREVLRLSSNELGHVPPPPPEVIARLGRDPEARPMRLPARDNEGYEDLWAPIVTAVRSPAVAASSEPGGLGARREVVGLARIGLSLTPAREQLQEVLSAGIVLTGALIILGALAALLIARAISEPVLALARGADEVRRGNLDVEIRVGSRDELGLLAESFNRMTAQLRATMAELAALNRGLEGEVERRTDEIRRQAEFTAVLNAPISPGIRETLTHGELQKLVGNALATLVAATGVRSAALWLVRDDRVDFELTRTVRHLAPAPSPAAAGDDAALAMVPCDEAAARAGRPLVEPLPLSADGLARERAVVPILFRGEPEGALVLVDETLSPDTVEFATHAAGPLAIAISNARAYTALQHLAKELKERNAALEKQRDQLQEMNRLKSEFLANVSHELRTPLNAILGYTEIIAEGIYGDITAEQREGLAGILESGQTLLTLINQILDLSKVESGKQEVYVTEVNLHDVVHAVVSEAQPLAKSRPYKVQAKCPVKVTVRTDAAKVKQILTNLVSNAVKFTEKGGVVVELRPEPGGGAALCVRDTGIGIRKEDQGIIFEEFRQVDGSSTRRFQGTGLGLSIARRFAQLLGGTIAVESTVGVGSTFTVTLPPEPPRRSSPSSPPLPAAARPSGKMEIVRPPPMPRTKGDPG